jgi:hypothetical protein
MHLTYPNADTNIVAVYSPESGEAGAPETEIEIITPKLVEDSVKIVEEWLIENSDAVRDNGGTGDIQSLLDLLWDSWKNNT